jgi:predicted nuclease with RNAse H fold
MPNANDRFVGVDVQVQRGVVAVAMDRELRPAQVEWIQGSAASIARDLATLVGGLAAMGGRVVVGVDSPRRPLTRPREWYWSGSSRSWRLRRGTDRGAGRHCEVVVAALRLANPQWTPVGDAPDWMKLGFAIFGCLEAAGIGAEEVFPSAARRQLKDEDVTFSISTRDLCLGCRDVLDASLAAVTVREYAEGRGGAVGGGDGLGTIVLPRPVAPGIQEAVLRWPGPTVSS